MEFKLSSKERTYLRALAAKQAEYASLPVMARRKQMWYDLNDGRKDARPPVVIETWTSTAIFCRKTCLFVPPRWADPSKASC